MTTEETTTEAPETHNLSVQVVLNGDVMGKVERNEVSGLDVQDVTLGLLARMNHMVISAPLEAEAEAAAQAETKAGATAGPEGLKIINPNSIEGRLSSP